MKRAFFTALVIFTLTNSSFAQFPELKIEGSFNPINVFFLDKNKYYNRTTDSENFVRYNNKVAPELGINVTTDRPEKKWNYVAGLSIKKLSFNHTIVIQIPTEPINISYWRDRTLELTLLGIDLSTQYKLTDKTDALIGLELNKPIKKNTSVENDNNFSFWEDNSYALKLREHESIDIMKILPYTMPELSFKTKLTPLISINYGTKIRPWSLNDIYSINLFGFTSAGEEPRSIIDSEVKSGHFYFFFGFNYLIN